MDMYINFFIFLLVKYYYMFILKMSNICFKCKKKYLILELKCVNIGMLLIK